MWWYLVILGSAVLLGLADIYRKKTLTREHTMQFVTAFVTLLFLFSFAFVIAGKVDFSISFSQIAFIALKSVLILTAFIMIMKALRHTDISKTAPLKNLSIIGVVALGVIVLGESLSWKGGLGILALLIGTYLVDLNPNIKHHFHPLSIFKNKYSVFILIYLIAISFVGLIDKLVLDQQGVGIFTFFFFTSLFNTIFAWTIQISFYEGKMDVRNAFKQGKSWLIIAAVLTIVSDIIYFRALAVPAVYLSLAAPLRKMSTLVSTFFGGKMMHEKHLKFRIIGCTVMLIGAFLILT